MDNIYGNVILPEMGKGADSPGCHKELTLNSKTTSHVLMDPVYGNVILPEMGKGADSPDCHKSPHYSPYVTQQPSGSKGNVSTSRGLLLFSLALSVGLLAGLVAVAYLYSNAQTKLDLIEALHKNVSATLNTTETKLDLIKAQLKNLTATLNTTDSIAQTMLDLIEALHKNLSAALNTTDTCVCRVCPEGWANNSGRCYLFSSTNKTWSQSRDHCITLGGHLVIVNNQEEQSFLSQSAIEDFYWIGLNDLETEGQWIWVDSTPLNETGAVFWLKRSDKPDEPDEPDNWMGENSSGEDCGVVSKIGEWFDNSCNKLFTFVCERPLIGLD
ncbi:asialoglycoprotein receptor 1-like [Clupea harengus]|uniref:Asialoglycoprotein receptor 1-like n=1 Tax=Clupea harengus TaxID=7950 RepID=A0A6P8GVR6_CLUHA|nr:asialoglycoprotein receptor 1-like [Clupea harengus]